MRCGWVAAITILAVLIFSSPVSASITIYGGCVGDIVQVKSSGSVYVVYILNNGTPVFSIADPVSYFKPEVPGKLRVQIYDSDFRLVEEKVIDVRTCTAGFRSLPSGEFTKVVGGEVYRIPWRTALGALELASQIKAFTYTLKVTEWGLFVDCVMGKCTGSEGNTSGWMYWVNYPTSPLPSVGAAEYRVYPGDEVVWYFSRSMSETPETSPYKIVIDLGQNYEVRVSVLWSSGRTNESAASNTAANGSTYSTLNYTYTYTNSSAEFRVLLNGTRKLEMPEGIEKIGIKYFVLKGNGSVNLSIEITQCPGTPMYGRIFGCFKLSISGSASNVSGISVFPVLNNSSLRILRLTDYWWRYADNISNGSYAIILPWKDFPLKPNDTVILKALEYLRSLQREDGGFANPGEETSISKTSWAIMAIVAAYQDPHEWRKNGNSPVDYIRNRIKGDLDKMGTTDIERTILALVAAKENPRNFEGIDLVKLLKDRVKKSGKIGDYIYTTIWGIIALVSVNENVSKSVEWLKSHQNGDGGFGWVEGAESDYDDTAAAIQALIAAGEPRNSEVIKKALSYLKTGQNDDGGFRYFGNSSSNAASDSWIMQALVAAGQNPRDWRKNQSVVDHLLSLQGGDGHFNYTAYVTSNPGYMTVCAIMALLGRTHPIRPVHLEEINISAEFSAENWNASEVTHSHVGKTPLQTAPPVVTTSASYAAKTPDFNFVPALIIMLILSVFEKSRRRGFR